MLGVKCDLFTLQVCCSLFTCHEDKKNHLATHSEAEKKKPAWDWVHGKICAGGCLKCDGELDLKFQKLSLNSHICETCATVQCGNECGCFAYV